MKSKTFARLMNFWPPFLGAGVKVTEISDDFDDVKIKMKLHRWNSNAVGTHFGGSIFSMTDPFYSLILLKNLGKEYIVWDKAASIKFKKPGKGTLTAHFNVSKERLQEIREEASKNDKSEPVFTVYVKDEAGDVVAEVEKTLYVRRKDKTPPPRAPKQ
ncbi:MAG: YiiD C-terminal domain-containing protein [Micavibrio sp.]|nr:YiiD C-terminal domain-containing protein [Micavibrio sp.]